MSADHAGPAHDLSWHLGRGPLADRQAIRDTYDDLGTARCPLCRAPLVARQGRAGPYFHCLCPPRMERAPQTCAVRRCA